jgi:quinol-cytochrome oxidoreductase complex cytochrome b subunit
VRREGWRFYPYHFVNWSAFGMALLGLLVFLAGLFPTGIGPEVDYGHPPGTVAQPWYLRAPLLFARALPAPFAWPLIGLAALALLFLPLLDRSQPGSRALRGVRLVFALLAVLAVAAGAWEGTGA